MKVGVIANPVSGKDVRRIVSDAFTFNNFEKLNIIKRIVRTALSFGKMEFIFMPEEFGFGNRIKEEFGDSISILPFKPEGENDTVKSARMMEQFDVCCIIVLGGDGTNRLVAKGLTTTPVIPISTGTNNAYPKFCEGTAVGLALAGILKMGTIEKNFLLRQKKLELLENNTLKDIALVDIAVIRGDFVGSKAVVEPNKIKELFVSFAEPGVIGLSAIFAYHTPIKRHSEFWGYSKIGKDGFSIKTPIMPGKVDTVKVENIKILNKNDKIPISFQPAIAALDGERVVYLNKNRFFVRMNPNGPYILDIQKILKEIPSKKLFVL